MMNKKGIELSINFLVSFILAIVIFGMAVIFMYNIFFAAEDTIGGIGEEFASDIADLQCNVEDVVCVSSNNAEMAPGDSGKFGVHATNIYTQKENFEVTVACARYVDTQDNQLDCSAADPIPFISDEVGLILDVNPGNTGKTGVLVFVDRAVPAGTYFYNVRVRPQGDADDSRMITKRYRVIVG